MLRTATKKTITSFLLLLAAMPLIYILFFRVQQQSIRKKMKERLEAQVLHTVTIPENEVHWIKNAKEILINSRMFDIRSYKIQNGEYIFWGLYDDDESILLKQLQKNQQNNSRDDKLLVQFLQFLQSCYHNQQEEFVFCENMNCPKLIGNTPSLHSGFISIFSPPPQV